MPMIYWIQATQRSWDLANKCCLLKHSSSPDHTRTFYASRHLSIQTGFLTYILATKLSSACLYWESKQFCDIVEKWSDEPNLVQTVNSFSCLWCLIMGTFREGFMVVPLWFRLKPVHGKAKTDSSSHWILIIKVNSCTLPRQSSSWVCSVCLVLKGVWEHQDAGYSFYWENLLSALTWSSFLWHKIKDNLGMKLGRNPSCSLIFICSSTMHILNAERSGRSLIVNLSGSLGVASSAIWGALCLWIVGCSRGGQPCCSLACGSIMVTCEDRI